MSFAEEKVIEKVRKLLALATSANEHEAAAAAAKAQELLQKYNLSMSQIGAEECGEDVSRHDLEETNRSSWNDQLINAVATTNFCRVVRMSARTKGTRGYRDVWKFAIFGKPSSIEVVEYLYNYLAREINRLSKDATKARGENSSSAFGHAFRLGAVAEIRQRLREGMVAFEADPNAKALVVTTDKLVLTRRDADFPQLGTTRRGAASDWNGYRAGQEAGQNIGLRPGLSDRNVAGQFLLK